MPKIITVGGNVVTTTSGGTTYALSTTAPAGEGILLATAFTNGSASTYTSLPFATLESGYSYEGVFAFDVALDGDDNGCLTGKILNATIPSGWLSYTGPSPRFIKIGIYYMSSSSWEVIITGYFDGNVSAISSTPVNFFAFSNSFSTLSTTPIMQIVYSGQSGVQSPKVTLRGYLHQI